MDYKVVMENELIFSGYVIEIDMNKDDYYKIIPKFWEDIMKDNRWKELLNNMNSFGPLGISYNYDGINKTFKYMIGVRNNVFLEDGDIVSFKTQEFAIFEAVGALPDALQNLIKDVHSKWLPTSMYEHSGGPEIEIYSDGDASSKDYVCYYWLPVKRK